TRANVAGVPVDFFETGRPSGFTPLTLIASMNGQIIQKVGNQRIKDFLMEKRNQGGMRASDVPELLKLCAADLNWVLDIFRATADRDLDSLTPVEQLYKAGGVALKTAQKFSRDAYA